MKSNTKKPSLKQVLSGNDGPVAAPALEEAKSFAAPVEVAGKFVTIKLPKSILSYLNVKGVTELNVVPINNTLQITGGQVLTGYPAIDLTQLENQFAKV